MPTWAPWWLVILIAVLVVLCILYLLGIQFDLNTR
jgi:hypothetical protein